ncbi:hypothetical protein [Okeania sp. SIO3I5]|nr:hypothetical protein [Okeania sp. SIO3I5]
MKEKTSKQDLLLQESQEQLEKQKNQTKIFYLTPDDNCLCKSRVKI